MTAVPSALPSRNRLLAAIREIENLSTAPHVLRHAMALLADVNADIDKVVGLIRTDAALAADIIRAANSAYYSSGERVASLERAVEKIGFRESIHLLNMSVVHLLASRDLACYGIPAEVYWAESLYHGLFLEELARETGVGEPETAHTVGLLRYVGRLALNQALRELGGGLFWDGVTPLDDWELREVGVSQAEAAGVLLRAWRFPEPLCEAVECQIDPSRAGRENWHAQALRFAADTLTAGQMPLAIADSITHVPPSEFAKEYRLDLARVEGVLKRVGDRFNEISRSLYD
jgi:HD-like signal output (HDOD) protein